MHTLYLTHTRTHRTGYCPQNHQQQLYCSSSINSKALMLYFVIALFYMTWILILYFCYFELMSLCKRNSTRMQGTVKVRRATPLVPCSIASTPTVQSAHAESTASTIGDGARDGPTVNTGRIADSDTKLSHWQDLVCSSHGELITDGLSSTRRLHELNSRQTSLVDQLFDW